MASSSRAGHGGNTSAQVGRDRVARCVPRRLQLASSEVVGKRPTLAGQQRINATAFVEHCTLHCFSGERLPRSIERSAGEVGDNAAEDRRRQHGDQERTHCALVVHREAHKSRAQHSGLHRRRWEQVGETVRPRPRGGGRRRSG
jgi:hypothetical protein